MSLCLFGDAEFQKTSRCHRAADLPQDHHVTREVVLWDSQPSLIQAVMHVLVVLVLVNLYREKLNLKDGLIFVVEIWSLVNDQPFTLSFFFWMALQHAQSEPLLLQMFFLAEVLMTIFKLFNSWESGNMSKQDFMSGKKYHGSIFLVTFYGSFIP